MPSVTWIALLEFAGNSRVFLIPQAPGAQWELGAAGNAASGGLCSFCEIPIVQLLRLLLRQLGQKKTIYQTLMQIVVVALPLIGRKRSRTTTPD